MTTPTDYTQLLAAKALAQGLDWNSDAERDAFFFWINDAIEKQLVADFFIEADAAERRKARRQERKAREAMLEDIKAQLA